MQFTKLRLAGFKSFVEPTELIIDEGLTGVVGPNGCGKSNLLEALRWVMGENSYKSMRGEAMDDVIFNGTANRPKRNNAEVTVFLDNQKRTAPAGFNDEDDLEISRRIVRESGSAYSINKKDARARDIQLLFADASTGSRSPALVRQGQISELISAKPQSRRRILEEAAGITGLHTRRHEAELKLKATETNLTRVDDVVGQLEQQLANLKRQARQATRYKNITNEIKRLEASSLYIAWHESRDAVELAESELSSVTRLLGQHTQAASVAAREAMAVNEQLPKLRDEATVRAAVLQRLITERDNLEAEERRANERQDQLHNLLQQTADDLGREAELINDAESVYHRLDEEERTLKANDEDNAKHHIKALAELQATAEALRQSQEEFDEKTNIKSQLIAKRDALSRSLDDIKQRLSRVQNELSEVTTKYDALNLTVNAASNLDKFARDVEGAQETLDKSSQALETAEADVNAARENERLARQDYDQTRREADNLSTEVRTLIKLLKVSDGEFWPPLIDSMKVKTGYEIALGAALGDDLDAPTDANAPMYWSELGSENITAVLPDSVISLAEFVDAPASLHRRLSQIGVVDAKDGERLSKRLAPGQRLVSTEGDLWRWDGLIAKANAPTAAAIRLAERNRLAELQEKSTQTAQEAANKRTISKDAREQMEKCIAKEQEARNTWRDANKALEDARANLSHEEIALSKTTAENSALEEAKRRLEKDAAELQKILTEAQSELDGLETTDTIDDTIENLRNVLDEKREAYTQARAIQDGFDREAKMRTERLEAVVSERDNWKNRTQKAKEQIDVLEKRSERAQAELTTLQNLPSEWKEKRLKLTSSLSDAEKDKQKADDALVVAEENGRERAKLEREANDTLNETQQLKARLEERFEAARERTSEMIARIADALGGTPEQALEAAGIDKDDELPDTETVENRLAKLRAERERLGAVNLRAEEESAEITAEIETLIKEREDLISAINKLRHGINSLNREARSRLLSAFETVNENFGELFSTLFSGGKAELKLTDSEDPLEAGLEIYAQPPGKRTEVMSLMSGGEQALTASALIFAVFLTNPSPICVLDEVDAPLDDANTERYCNLLEEMNRKTDTRFLIITHNPLTMARMNRLFGVTMMEKGISQLVSVSVEEAERIREAS